MNVTAKTDTSKFEAAAGQCKKAVQKWGTKCLRDGIGVYQRWMAQMAPPWMGKSTEDAKSSDKLYKLKHRKIWVLPTAIKRDKRHAGEYRDKLREGFSYVVKGYKREYFKAKRGAVPKEALQASNIEFRFLLKWAFVGNLPSVGIATPKAARWNTVKPTGQYSQNKVRTMSGTVQTATVQPNRDGVKFRTATQFTNPALVKNQASWQQIARGRASAKLQEYINTAIKRAGFNVKVAY